MKGQTQLAPVDRFHRAYKIDGEGCWIWTRALDTAGYGAFKVAGKSIRASRFAYLAMVGPIPAGMCVCHVCDVRECVNPSHLWLGSNADNSADMVSKSRSVKGRRNGSARLNQSQVNEIKTSTTSSSILAKKFGISRQHANRIKSGARWT